MDDAMIPISPAAIIPSDLLQKARDYAFESKAPNSRRAAQSDWKAFTTWCTDRRLDPLPAVPETVAFYLTDRADHLKPSTLQRHLSTIGSAHTAAGYADSPTKSAVVKAVWAGIKRTKGVAQIGKAPILTMDLRAMLATLPNTIAGMRDRAILVVGFSGAFRRSELVALNVADLEFNSEGLTITLRRSKTDQNGQGQKVGIPHGNNAETCPVSALREWLHAAGITEGAVFRPVDKHGNIGVLRMTDQTIALIVKRTCKAGGLDPERFSGHSLRSGLATQAAINGVADRSIMKQTRHKSHAVFSRYVRDTSLFRNNAAGLVGL